MKAITKTYILISLFGAVIIAAGYGWLVSSSSRSSDFNFGPAWLMILGILILISGIIGTIANWRQK